MEESRESSRNRAAAGSEEGDKTSADDTPIGLRAGTLFRIRRNNAAEAEKKRKQTWLSRGRNFGSGPELNFVLPTKDATLRYDATLSVRLNLIKIVATGQQVDRGWKNLSSSCPSSDDSRRDLHSEDKVSYILRISGSIPGSDKKRLRLSQKDASGADVVSFWIGETTE